MQVDLQVGLQEATFLSMANTRFFLDTRNAKDGKPCVLKLAIAHKKKTALISLDVKLDPNKQWEGDKIVEHDDKFVLNTYINRIKNTVESRIIQWKNDGSLANMTAYDIKAKCEEELKPEKKKEKEDETTFVFRFKKYASRMTNGSKRTFDHTLNRLEAFTSLPNHISLEKLKFEDITVDWLTDFDTFLSKTAKINTRNIHYRNIRTVFNDALEDGITQFYPFRRFKIKNEITPDRSLTVEELRQLIFFDCEEHAKKYRDIFLLMFYLMGINNVDLCNLKEIVKGRLEFHRTKTNHFFSMKVEPEAKAILKKYKGKKYLLDIMDHWDSDVFFRKKMNKTLQKIGPVTRSGLGGKKDYAPLFPKLTTYYARHSWASIAADLDIPIETISEGLGHEYGNKITRIYIHKYDYRKIDEANRKVIDWVLYGKKDGKIVVEPGTPKFFGLKQKDAEKLGLLREVPEKKKKNSKKNNPTSDPTKTKSSRVA